MKVKKLVLGIFAFVVLSFLTVGKASANEGIIRLSGSSADAGRCYAVSVFVEGNFRVLMTCRDLKMAADPVQNKYVVWVQQGTDNVRLGEIESGKMESSIDSPFERMFVTLEKDSYPYSPSGTVIMAGQVEAINFGTGTTDTSIIKLSPTPSVSVSASPTTVVGQPVNLTPTPATAGAGNRLVAVVAGIGKAILIGFILLLVVVGVMGFLARRKTL